MVNKLTKLGLVVLLLLCTALPISANCPIISGGVSCANPPSTFGIPFTNPINRSHFLLNSLKNWWRVIPALDGGDKLWDLAGQAYATLTNMTSASGWRGTTRPGGDGEIRLAGPSQGSASLNMGTRTDATGPFTIMFWIKGPTGQPDFTSIGGQTNSSNWNNGWGFYYYEGDIYFWIEGYGFTASIAVDIDTTVWRHLAGTWDGTTITLYVDGVSQGPYPYSGTLTTGHTFEIGRLKDDTTTWEGSFDDIMLFSSALPQGHIRAIMELQKMGSPGLLTRYNLIPLQEVAAAPGTPKRKNFFLVDGQ